MVIHSIQGNNQMTMNLMVGTSLKKDKRRKQACDEARSFPLIIVVLLKWFLPFGV